MRIFSVTTYWSAEQADAIYEFLGELRTAIWQEYHEDIQQMYDEMRQQALKTHEDFDDDIEF